MTAERAEQILRRSDAPRGVGSLRARPNNLHSATINAEIEGHAEKTSGSARSARSALYVVRYSRQAGKNFLTMTNSQTHRIGF
ncbi:MAG: hypothetical protein DMF94_23055 [Acidobacteria bacterium]|nr:MAG: hypothetical protein DMF94_23055 [Acidobacteriota bacterium]